ncbi:MAG: MMPL family transporter [Proteobacteria bacterium]|nr:MMPL family transporter [Pseudomonadota bacterium]
MTQSGPYGQLVRFVLAHRRAVALVLAVIVLLSGIAGLPPKVASNLLELMPQRSKTAQALRTLNEEEGGVNLLTLAFEGDSPESMDTFLDKMVLDFEEMDEVAHAIHEVDEDLAFQIALLQLQPSDVAELSSRLHGALKLGSAARNPMIAGTLMRMGPLTERIAKAQDISLFGKSDKSGRILIRPTGSSNDQDFTMPFMEKVEHYVDESLAATPGIELVWMGGAYRHAVEDVKGIRHDILVTSMAASILVLLVVILAFRSIKATILVFTPLACANVVNLGVVWLFMGHLNTYTSFATAILIGLGIAFAVHLVGRYREERNSGLEVEIAIERAWDRVGPPCMTAALTSAAGFLALAAADFRGFSQLGVILSIGLMLCLGMMLVMLPLLIPILDHQPAMLLGAQASTPDSSRSTYRFAPVALMIAVLATGVIGASRLPEIGWEFDMSALRRDGLSYDELTTAERDLARESYAPTIVSYPDKETLASDQKRLQQLVEAQKVDYIARVISLENVLPSDQAERLAALTQLKQLLFEQELKDGTVGQHPNFLYLPPVFIQRLEPLRHHGLQLLTREDIPPGLLTVLGSTAEDKHRILLFPRGNMWDMREAEKLLTEVTKVLPDRPVAGEHLFVGDMYRMVRRDMPIVGVLALLMVIGLAAIDLRKLHWIASATLTLMAGMIWSGSVLQIIGVKLSMLNVVGIPILLGIGIDVVIHLLHRIREEGPGGVRRALRTTGVAAFIATATSVLSFCSLMFAGSRGIRSLGLLVVVGLITIFLASAIILPLIWTAGWRVTGRAPADNIR